MDRIVENLSHHEIRYLRDRLNSFVFTKDICSSLPVELLITVSQYLHLEDILVARSVSRAWRARFSSPDFAVGVAKLHFRTHWARTPLDNAAAKEELANWLPKASAMRSRKRRGNCKSVSIFHYCHNGRLWQIDGKFDHQYHSGRVAYNFGEGIVVQDLKAGPQAISEVYFDPTRNPLLSNSWALSDQFLVGQATGRLFLTAWSLSDHKIQKVKLHSAIKFMSVRGKHVGLINDANEVLIWDIGGSTVLTKRPEIQYWSPKAIVFHPVKEGHFFIFHTVETEHQIQSFVDGRYRASYREPVSAKTRQLCRQDPAVYTIGSNGLYKIGREESEHYPFFVVKTFNIHTLKFDTISPPSRSFHPKLEDKVLPFWKEHTSDPPLGKAVNMSSGLALSKTYMIDICPETSSDDSVEVLFGSFGYIVWTFDDAVLPVASSLSDLSLDVFPRARPFPLETMATRLYGR